MFFKGRRECKSEYRYILYGLELFMLLVKNKNCASKKIYNDRNIKKEQPKLIFFFLTLLLKNYSMYVIIVIIPSNNCNHK